MPAEHVRGYEERGYAVVAAVVDPDTVAAALKDMAHLADGIGLPDAAMVAAPPGWPFAEQMGSDPRITAVAESALGGPVTCFAYTYLRKPPAGGRAARWHQDGGPWRERLGGAAALTVWVALTPSDARNGGLRVVPGSQRGELQPLTSDPPGTVSLFGIGLPAGTVDEARAVAVAADAGDAVLLHPTLLHASDVNRSDRARVAVALRYRAGAS